MAKTTTKIPKSKKKSFSSFKYNEAFKYLGVKQLNLWQIEGSSLEPSNFFQQYIERLQVFDIRRSEEAKKFLIDAFLLEVAPQFPRLKIWKGAPLESDRLQGEADYLVTENKAFLEAPMLCAIEAKKDDFEQGLAQCLVEMQACQWQNHELGRQIDVFGIVTNGQGWIFYKLTLAGEVYETRMYAADDAEKTLGTLYAVFQACEKNLD
jgi:predicted type IV restriction endonuclease